MEFLRSFKMGFSTKHLNFFKNRILFKAVADGDFFSGGEGAKLEKIEKVQLNYLLKLII